MPIISNGIRRVSVYDPTDGTTVQMNNIIAGDETQFAIRQLVDETPTDPTGGRYFGGYRSEAVWKFIDSTGLLAAQLQTWFNDGTRVSMVAQGLSRNVQWYTTDRCEVVRDPILSRLQGRGDVYEARMVRVGGDDASHNIHGNVNLLSYLGWADSNTNGIADGYTIFGPLTGSFGGADPDSVQVLQTLNGTDPETGFLRTGLKNVVFPISGITITFGTHFGEPNRVIANMILHLLDFSGSSLTSTANKNINLGFENVSINTGANVYDISPRVQAEFVTPFQKLDFNELSLRTDGSGSWTNQ